MKSWLKRSQLTLSIVLTVIVVGCLLFELDFRAIVQVVSEASFGWIAFGFLYFVLYQVFRTARFFVLFHSRKNEILTLFSVQCIHAFLNGMLPAGTGELAYIVVLERLYRIPVTEGATTLYLARTADLAVFVLLFCVLRFLNWGRMPGAVEYVMQIMTLLVGMLVAIAILASVLGQSMVTKIRTTLKPGAENQHRWVMLVLDKVVEVIESFRVIRSARVYVAVMLFSAVMWTFMYLVYFAVIRAVRLELGPSQVLFLFLILWPISLLPVKGVANLGTFEGGWVIGLGLLGVSEAAGIVVAFGSHAIMLTYVIGVLIFPLLLYGRNWLGVLWGWSKLGVKRR